MGFVIFIVILLLFLILISNGSSTQTKSNSKIKIEKPSLKEIGMYNMELAIRYWDYGKKDIKKDEEVYCRLMTLWNEIIGLAAQARMAELKGCLEGNFDGGVYKIYGLEEYEVYHEEFLKFITPFKKDLLDMAKIARRVETSRNYELSEDEQLLRSKKFMIFFNKLNDEKLFDSFYKEQISTHFKNSEIDL